jgi:CHAD domain-containing protein
MVLVTSAPETAGATDSDRLIEAFDRFRREIEAQRGPAVIGDEPEALHDFRVAVRRTRSGLKHSAGLLSHKQRKRFQAAFSQLQDVTGPARDYEVWMASLPHDDPLRLVLAGYHHAARRDAVAALGSRDTKKLLARWHTLLADLPSGDPAVSGETSIGQQQERVMEAANAAGVDADTAALHHLRKRVKELRYLIELFVDSAERPLRKPLKKLQDALGDVQDVAVQRAWLTEHVDEVGPIDVRLKELDEREAVARGAYGERFAEFVTLAGHDRETHEDNEDDEVNEGRDDARR